MADRKARIITQYFAQIQKVDFENTYTMIVRLESFRLLLAIVIYIEQPKDFIEERDKMV